MRCKLSSYVAEGLSSVCCYRQSVTLHVNYSYFVSTRLSQPSHQSTPARSVLSLIELAHGEQKVDHFASDFFFCLLLNIPHSNVDSVVCVVVYGVSTYQLTHQVHSNNKGERKEFISLQLIL